MTWLNLSLKLHIRLKTISFLIPTHITHVYVQWMSYSFVWLFFIKCVAHAQLYVDQTQKIFECFNCFWKVFCFEKCQKFQKLWHLVLATCLAGQASCMPQSWACTEGFCDSLAGQSPSREKDLEIFSKIWVFRFLATQFGGLFASGSSSHEVYSESVVAPFATSLRVDLPVAKNT